MAVIYIDSAKLKSFSSTTKNGTSSIRIELETKDPIRLGYILSDLVELQAEQKAAGKPTPKNPAKPTSAPQLALPAPSLRIAYRSEDE